MELHEGQLITPTLRLKRLLGKGGMGSVWLAEHQTLQTQVAVKFLSPEYLTSPEAVERFKREATAAAQIRSPHVVQTLDHGITAGNVPFIVLELLEGEELGARMEREPRLPLALVARIVSQACKALSKAHSLSIVHRDIKPDNIFLIDVDGEPFIKVLDFGIAKKTDDRGLNMTSTNAMIGTPYYMSPEQAFSSKDVDHRTDLWALAVVAYYALTDKVPFDGETVGAICLSIDKATFPPASSIRPDLPPAIDEWFARALTRRLDRRFNSAREMADAFLLAAGEDASLSGPASIAWSARGNTSIPALSAPAQAPHRARLPVVVGSLAALAVVAGGLFFYRASSATPAASTGNPAAASVAAPPPASTAQSPQTAPSAATPPATAPSATAPASSTAAAPPGTAAQGKPGSKAPTAATTQTAAATQTTAAPQATAAPPSTKVDRGF